MLGQRFVVGSSNFFMHATTSVPNMACMRLHLRVGQPYSSRIFNVRAGHEAF